MAASALLIDDDTDLLRSWQRLAAGRGYDITVAASWSEGIALFHVLSPDLVIADYNLPGSQHGLRLLAAVRRLRPSVRLVLISGVIEPTRLDQVESLGLVDLVLSKGDTSSALEAFLDELAGVANQERSPTDWKAFAKSYGRADAISDDEIEELDRILMDDIERHKI